MLSNVIVIIWLLFIQCFRLYDRFQEAVLAKLFKNLAY
jgi:hypothetical protein